MNATGSARDVSTDRVAVSPEVFAAYRYWRFRILYASIAGYAMYYIVRTNLSMALPGMEADLGVTKLTLGLFLTLHGVLYGVSKFLNGVWGDRADPRIFMSIGLWFCSLASLLFGMTSTAVVFGVIWLANGWFQGMGCGPCIKSLSNWYPPSQRGFRFSIWNTSHNIGSAFVFLLASALAVFPWHNWRMFFFFPAAIGFAGVLFLLNRMRDTPESLGLPPVEEIYGQRPEIDHGTDDEISNARFRALLAKRVFGNPGVWLVGIASFFVYVGRYTVLYWGPTFLPEMKGVTLAQSGVLVAAHETAGVGGMLAAGWLMDRVFKGNGSLVCVLFMLAYAVLALLFWMLPIESAAVYTVLLCGMGFVVYGPQCLLGPISANMATKKAAASANGFVGLFSYMGTFASGIGMGAMAHQFGWRLSFFGVILSGILAASIFAVPAIWDFSHKRDV
ncbi:MAG: MFS transporter [Pirellulales bacterium]|nr:MFS transporter [Pirellulales bacterium]